MWQHTIISDLSKTSIKFKGKRIDFEVAGGEAHKLLKAGLPMLKKGLPSAQCFYMVNLEMSQRFTDRFENNSEEMIAFYDYENISFPYNMTLWEYSLPEGARHGIKREAVFVVDSDDKVFIWPLILSPVYKIWIPCLYSIFLFKNSEGLMRITTPSDLREGEEEEFRTIAQRVVSYTLSFLKIFSCKYVVQETITSYQNRKYKYKVLRIAPFGSDCESSKYLNVSQDYGRTPRCSGYLKKLKMVFPWNV